MNQKIKLSKEKIIEFCKENYIIKLAARNIPNIDVAVVGKLNVYDILVHEKILLTQKAVERMKEVYLA